jgi:hypothetical protein
MARRRLAGYAIYGPHEPRLRRALVLWQASRSAGVRVEPLGWLVFVGIGAASSFVASWSWWAGGLAGTVALGLVWVVVAVVVAVRRREIFAGWSDPRTAFAAAVPPVSDSVTFYRAAGEWAEVQRSGNGWRGVLVEHSRRRPAAGFLTVWSGIPGPAAGAVADAREALAGVLTMAARDEDAAERAVAAARDAPVELESLSVDCRPVTAALVRAGEAWAAVARTDRGELLLTAVGVPFGDVRLFRWGSESRSGPFAA